MRNFIIQHKPAPWKTNTPYDTYSMQKKNLQKKPISDFMILPEWFHENHMTLNLEKCHFMVIGSKDPPHQILLSNSEVTSSNEEKLLGILLDSKLNFENYLSSLCRKSGQKLNALGRLRNYLISNQRNLLLNSVIKSQFTYYFLINMGLYVTLLNALNKIHKWVLRLIYRSIDRLIYVKKYSSENFVFLAFEICKFYNDLSPSIMNEIFIP